jgi:hypothetical protein
MWWLENCSLNYVVDLVDCWIVVDWSNENKADALFSSTNRAAMTLGLCCFAQRQRRRERMGEEERARKKRDSALLAVEI